jgi:hypothetical protein
VDYPSEEEEPQYRSETELKNCHPEAPLHELAQSRNEEAAHSGNHVTRGTLAGHRRTSGLSLSFNYESPENRFPYSLKRKAAIR